MAQVTEEARNEAAKLLNDLVIDVDDKARCPPDPCAATPFTTMGTFLTAIGLDPGAVPFCAWLTDAGSLSDELARGAQVGPFRLCYTQPALLNTVRKPFNRQVNEVKKLLGEAGKHNRAALKLKRHVDKGELAEDFALSAGQRETYEKAGAEHLANIIAAIQAAQQATQAKLQAAADNPLLTPDWAQHHIAALFDEVLADSEETAPGWSKAILRDVAIRVAWPVYKEECEKAFFQHSLLISSQLKNAKKKGAAADSAGAAGAPTTPQLNSLAPQSTPATMQDIASLQKDAAVIHELKTMMPDLRKFAQTNNARKRSGPEDRSAEPQQAATKKRKTKEPESSVTSDVTSGAGRDEAPTQGGKGSGKVKPGRAWHRRQHKHSKSPAASASPVHHPTQEAGGKKRKNARGRGKPPAR